MKHYFALALGAVFLMSGLAASASPTPAPSTAGSKVYELSAQNGSGEHGTVAFKPRGQKTVIEIHLLGAPAGSQPAHIHMGSCAKLDPAPKYPLSPVVAGVSETTLDQPISALTAGGMAVNVHKSADDLKTYVACGDIG